MNVETDAVLLRRGKEKIRISVVDSIKKKKKLTSQQHTHTQYTVNLFVRP